MNFLQPLSKGHQAWPDVIECLSTLRPGVPYDLSCRVISRQRVDGHQGSSGGKAIIKDQLHIPYSFMMMESPLNGLYCFVDPGTVATIWFSEGHCSQISEFPTFNLGISRYKFHKLDLKHNRTNDNLSLRRTR